MREPIKKTVEIYKLLDTWMRDTLTKDPAQARNIYTSNVYTRALSLLMGRGPTQITPLLCEDNGVLRVTPEGRDIGTPIVANETISGAGTETETLTSPGCRFCLWTWDYDIKMSIVDGDGNTSGYITCYADSYWEQPCYAKSFVLKNSDTDGSHDATYQLVVWRNLNFQGV